ncbi:hypothetical protein TWF281_000187 [Arthrobotrys megalospora]
MPPVTPSHVYALSRILPFTQTSLKPHNTDSIDTSKSTIKPTFFLNALALLLVSRPSDDFAAVSIARDPPHTRLYYTKSRPFDESDVAALEKIKQILFDTRVDHAARFLSLSVEICFERILSRAAVLGDVGRILGVTHDAPDGDFTTICVPDEETVWAYVLSKYDAKQLGKSNLIRVIQLLFLDYPKRGTQKDVVEGYLRMASLLAEVLSNGLELWSTGALAAPPLGGNGEKCGVFLAKKEFGTSGVDLEKVYAEAEELMGRIVDAVQDVGAYAKAASDIAEFVNGDVEFRRSVLEKRVVFQEVKPATPVLVEITGKPVDLLNKFLRKSGRAAVTDARLLRAFPEWPESRLKDAGKTLSCNVHCELNLILYVIRREYSIRNVNEVHIRYGCSEASCYLCEVYIEALRNHIIGRELEKFLIPVLGAKPEPEPEDLDDLSSIVSHLKGFTAQPGKTLRGWFSGVTQPEGGGTSSSQGSRKEAAGEQTQQKPKNMLTKLTQAAIAAEEKFENPGYSRGYRRLCVDWQFPKDTPAVVRREVEKNIEGKFRYIYSATRIPSKKIEESKKVEDLPPTVIQARG